MSITEKFPDPAGIVRRYTAGASLSELARECRVTRRRVRAFLLRHGATLRTLSEANRFAALARPRRGTTTGTTGRRAVRAKSRRKEKRATRKLASPKPARPTQPLVSSGASAAPATGEATASGSADAVPFSSREALFAAVGYVPHAGQRAFHSSPARFRVLIAGSRFGKSKAAAHEAAWLLMREGVRGWIVAPTYELGEKEFRYLAQIFLALKDRGVIAEFARFHYAERSGNMRLVLPWGAEVRVKSADRAESLLGEQLDFVVLAEAARLGTDIWARYLRARLLDRRGQMMLVTTPAGENWVYPLFLRGCNPAATDWAAWQQKSGDNPHLDPREITDAEATLPADIFAEQFLGEFTRRAGRVYASFSLATHVVPRESLVIEPGAPRYRAIDFGYTNPFVCLWGVRTGDDVLVITGEYYARLRTTGENARAILEHDVREFAGSARYERTFADPSAAQQRADLAALGVPSSLGANDIMSGIDAVRERLVVRRVGGPRLLIADSCVNLIREFSQYRYPDAPPDGTAPERPIKANDHALDALRYLVAGLKQRSAWAVLR